MWQVVAIAGAVVAAGGVIVWLAMRSARTSAANAASESSRADVAQASLEAKERFDRAEAEGLARTDRDNLDRLRPHDPPRH